MNIRGGKGDTADEQDTDQIFTAACQQVLDVAAASKENGRKVDERVVYSIGSEPAGWSAVTGVEIDREGGVMHDENFAVGSLATIDSAGEVAQQVHGYSCMRPRF